MCSFRYYALHTSYDSIDEFFFLPCYQFINVYYYLVDDNQVVTKVEINNRNNNSELLDNLYIME